MTRKHFAAIAETIRIRYECATSADARQAIEMLARDLCGDLKAANTNFNRARFLAACGISEH